MRKGGGRLRSRLTWPTRVVARTTSPAPSPTSWNC